MEKTNHVSQRSVLLVSVIVSFLGPYVSSSERIALPAISRDFHAGALLLSWIPTTYLLASAISLVPLGKISDIFGRKRVFVIGIILFTLSSLVCGFSTSIYMLIVARVFQGIANSMIYVTMFAILNSVYSSEKRGMAIGVVTSAVYLGLSSGPFFGGILTNNFGWQAIFLANVPVGIIVLIITLYGIKAEWKDSESRSIDYLGIIIYAVSLFCLIYGLSSIKEPLGIILLAAGGVGIAGFTLWELSPENPIFQVKLFVKNRVFTYSNLAAFINYGSTFAISFFMSLYLQYIKGYTEQQAGFILVSQPIVQAIFSPLAGRLSDKVDPRILATTGMSIISIGLFIFRFLSFDTDLTLIIINLCVLGFGFALFSSPNTNAVMNSVEKKYYSQASATVGTMRLVGQMISMGIAMLLISLLVGDEEINRQNYSRYFFLFSVNIGFTIFSSMCFVGIFFSFSRGASPKSRRN